MTAYLILALVLFGLNAVVACAFLWEEISGYRYKTYLRVDTVILGAWAAVSVAMTAWTVALLVGRFTE